MPNSVQSPVGPSPVAIVTGGSQGLGLALTRSLVQQGWTVVVDARRAERLERAQAEIGTSAMIAVAGDVTDRDHRRSLVATANAVGPIQLVVNNASTLGASPLPSLHDLDGETWRRIFDVNVVAPFELLRDADSALAPGATIINITSDAGVKPYEGWGGYGASKAALEQASRIFAAERPDLRVLIVDPGDMRTEMHQDAFPGEDISDREPPEASVAGLLTLIHGDQPSGGRYQARTATREGAT